MGFEFFQPNPFLSGIFRSYIVQRGFCEQEVSTVLGAKGLGAMMFPFDQPNCTSVLHSGSSLGQISTKPLLIGTSSAGNQATYLGPVNLLIFVFQATGPYHLLRADASPLLNRVVSIDEVGLPPMFMEAQDRLWGIKDSAVAVRLVESYFLRYFSTTALPKWRHDLGPVAHHIERLRGQMPVRALAQKFRVTPRALEKSFQHQIGTSPKEYSRVMRFKAAMQYIQVHPGASWLNVVAEFNYTDQSHLIRDFRQFSGYTPAQLRLQGLEIDQQLYHSI